MRAVASVGAEIIHLGFLAPHGKLVKLLLHWQYKGFWRSSKSETFPNIFRCASNVKWFC